MKSNCAVILTVVFSQHCLIKDAACFRFTMGSRLGPSWGSFFASCPKVAMLVLSIMVLTAQFESVEDREWEGEVWL